jgi:arginyl-tRNA synthetase
MGLRFDVYYNEASLYTEGKVEETLAALRERGLVYEKDGATWLRYSAIGRPQDRVVVKSSGEPTYRLPDIAYHREKLRRGFDRILNVQGADHIEEAKDVVAAIGALGLPADRIRYLIHQFVTITRGGVEVKMSTRRATYVTVDDLLDQVGSADVFRYFMITRSPESHLNFDLEAATETDWQKNPVFYIQYAHARVASIEKHARERGVAPLADDTDWTGLDLSPLEAREELQLIKALLRYPALVAGAARACEPHRVAVYLYELAAQLHGYHHMGTHNAVYRVVRPEEPELTRARLALARAVGQVIRNGLGLLGISAPESM